MNINYDECIWGDSTLEKIEIKMEYNDAVFTIHNDYLQKEIHIHCVSCVSMSDFLSWEENIIDSVLFNQVLDKKHPMLEKLEQLYDKMPYDLYEAIEGELYELQMKFINNVRLSIICKRVCFELG